MQEDTSSPLLPSLSPTNDNDHIDENLVSPSTSVASETTTISSFSSSSSNPCDDESKMCIETSTHEESSNREHLEEIKTPSQFILPNTLKSSSTPYYGSHDTEETTKPPKKSTKILGNALDWILNAIVWPLLNWTSLPLLIFFILMTNFQLFAFEWLFESEGDFFNTVDFDIIASIDNFLMFGLGMPHEFLAYLYHPFLDVFFAIPYLAHFVYPLAVYPIIVCIFLWKPNRESLKETVIVPTYHLLKQFITGKNNNTTEQEGAMIISSYNNNSNNSQNVSPKYQVSNYKLKCYLLSLGIISFIQVILCYVFPTAPPWFRDNTIKYEEYYDMVGDATLDMPVPVFPLFAPEARFEMVDRLIGYELFAGIYGKGTIKFGSFYSLHVGWTAIITFLELFVVYKSETKDEESLQNVQSEKSKWSFYQIFMIQYLIWIFLASMYSAHHFMIDGIVAVVLAVIITKISTKIIKNDAKQPSLTIEK